MRILRRVGVIEAPRDRIFTLLDDPKMADQIHPEFLRTEVVASPWVPKAGEKTSRRLTYRDTAYEIETELAEYRRGYFILERQVAGPFKSFEYAVSLEDVGDAGTSITEVLAYETSFRLLGRLFDRLVLRRDFEEVLATRERRLNDLLAG